MNNSDTLILFDVDGTLAESICQLKKPMLEKLRELKNKNYDLGILGGGNYKTICFQVQEENKELFKYIFSENGIESYRYGELIHENNIMNSVSQELLKEITDYILNWIQNKELPFRTTDFIEYKKGMLYSVPVGAKCTKEQRQEFIDYDKKYSIRKQLIDDLNNKFYDKDFEFLLGGAIGISIHPKGWNKTYALKHIKKPYKKIYYFGDRYTPDGNDYCVITHPKIIGYGVKNPENTLEFLQSLF